MKPVIFLRIASVLTLIHAALHTVGGVFGKPAPGVATMVAATMRTRFPAMGAMRSYSDFYLGMGLAVSIFLTVEAIAFWLLSSMAKSDSTRLRPLLAIFLLGYVALAVNSYALFFAAPVVVELLIAGCIGAAIFTAGGRTRSNLPEDVTEMNSARV
jgi:hypothetical protein